ncbi:hypothetical protein N7528_002626 [Penicillium herquei]|nr:hypothetical protein N7528_002626 [Penicillium herquei]
MQFKFSVFSIILAASSSAVAAPTGLLSPDSAISAIHALDIETNQLHSKINSTLDSQSYVDAISSGLQSLIEEKIKDNVEYGIEGSTEGFVGFTTFSQEQEKELCRNIVSFVDTDSSFFLRLEEIKKFINQPDYPIIAGSLRVDKRATYTLLNGLNKYAPSCSSEVLPYIQRQLAEENGAEETYSSSSLKSIGNLPL